MRDPATWTTDDRLRTALRAVRRAPASQYHWLVAMWAARDAGRRLVIVDAEPFGLRWRLTGYEHDAWGAAPGEVFFEVDGVPAGLGCVTAAVLATEYMTQGARLEAEPL